MIPRFAVAALWTAVFFLLSPHTLNAQLATEDHVAEPGFWPTQNAAARSDFAGAAACASCHGGIAATHRTIPMGNAALHASDSAILHTHPKMDFAVGAYHYELKTDGKNTMYTVTGGEHPLSYPLLWAFGIGRDGQSYLFKQDDGNYYEARVSFFDSLKALNFTPGRALASPKTAEEAMYRKVGPAEVVKCFGCHTTAGIFDGKLDEKNLTPGVSCEACHGPGAKHVAAMREAKISGIPESAPSLIFNSAKLSPTDSVDFCGACHGTFWDVKLAGVTGVSAARSQPYRLVTSKCWGKGDDPRLTCMACHDPHKQLETEAASYDHVCLSCHLNAVGAKPGADHPGAACPVNTKNCASCHMPKVLVPEMHADFTDHRIRVVRKGEPYPE
jgi:hypothetical protein